MNPEPRQTDGPTSLKHLFRETYDLVDEAVANITDEQVDDRLRVVLSRAGYSADVAGAEPVRPLVFAEGELVPEHRRDVERAERVLDLELAERALALREREVALQAQQAEVEERRANAEHRRRMEALEVEARTESERRRPVRRMLAQIVIATVTVGGYTVSAWLNAASLPLLSVSVAVLLYLGLVLVVTGRATKGSGEQRESAYKVLQVLWPFYRMSLLFHRADDEHDRAKTPRQRARAAKQRR